MEDEVKSFLGSLVEKGYAFLFFLSFLSVLFIALDGNSFGKNFTLNLTPWGFKLLLLSAVGLAAGGVWLMIKPSSDSKEKIDTSNTNGIAPESFLGHRKEFSEAIQSQKELIQSLRQAIRAIQSIAKQERNHATNQILKIIEDLGLAIENYEQDTIDAALIVKWVEERAESWIANLHTTSFSHAMKGKEFTEFQDDIRKYIKILCNNILCGLFDQEELKKVSPSHKSIFHYKEALKIIRSKIIEDLDSDPLPDLSMYQRQELLACLAQLIKDIR